MRAGHRDIQFVVDIREVPRRVDGCRQCVAARRAETGLRAGTRDGRHTLGREVHRAQQVILRVRDVERFAHQCHPLRVVERRRAVVAVRCADHAAADPRQDRSVERADDDLIMVRVRDKEPPMRRVRQYLAGIAERHRGRRLH